MVGEVGLFGLIQCTAFARVGGNSYYDALDGMFHYDLAYGIFRSHWDVGAPHLSGQVVTRPLVLVLAFSYAFWILVLLTSTG